MCCVVEKRTFKAKVLFWIHFMRDVQQKWRDEPSRVGKYTLLFGCYAVDENCSSAIFIKNRTHFKPEVGQTFVAYFFDPITDFGINLRRDRKIICACHDICAKFPVYS